jgi:hypothetical protein
LSSCTTGNFSRRAQIHEVKLFSLELVAEASPNHTWKELKETKSSWKRSAVNSCCGSDSEQLFLVSDPAGTHDQMFIRSKTIHIFGNGASSWTSGGVGLSE